MAHDDRDTRAGLGSGEPAALGPRYEERRIIIAQGLDFQEHEKRAKNDKFRRWAELLRSGPSQPQYDQFVSEFREMFATFPIPARDDQPGLNRLAGQLGNSQTYVFFDYLREQLGERFEIEEQDVRAVYPNDAQGVLYRLEFKLTKQELKQALETENLHVIYSGHSRYGRGACFDQYDGPVNRTGDQWSDGTNSDNGLFHLGYPYVAVEEHDMEHHQYHFRPVPVEQPEPPYRERHPDARRRLSRISLPAEIEALVHTDSMSPSAQYYAVVRRNKREILLRAGWENTSTTPCDLGATNIQCRCFCHFGCSSRKHFHRIIRRTQYKGWRRDNPPTTNFCYVTTNPSRPACTAFWLYQLLAYNRNNKSQSWFGSLEHARVAANRQLRAAREPYQIY